MKSRWMKLTVLFFAMLLLAACGGGGGGGGGFIPASGGGNDTTAPTVPTGLVAVGVSTSQINLSWNASTDNVAVTGYRIYRGGTYLKSVSGTSTSDTLVSASTQYCYTVQAYDAANNYSLETTQACASTWSPTGWGSAIRIGDFRFFMSYDLYYPRVALNDTNTAIAAWDEHESFNLGFGHIWSNVYKNGSWGTQVNISLNSQNSGEPSVAINAAGNGVAVWTVWNTTTNTKTIWGSLYSFATNTWSTPVMVSNPSGTNTVFWACEPKVVMDSLGNAVAVWSQSDNNHTYTIWTNRYNGSAWGTPEMLSSGTSLAGEPQLAISGNNNAFAVWRQSIDANLGKTFARIYSAASATWGTSATLIGNPTMTTGSTTRPRLAVNANGDAMVAWEESNGTGHSIASAYYDHLSSWQTPTYVTMDTTTAFPAVAIDGSGNAYAGWQQSPSPFQGWMSRYDYSSKKWTAPARFDIDTSTSGVTGIAIDVDGSGNVLFAWMQGQLRARWYMAATGWNAPTSMIGGTDLSLDVNSAGNAIIVSSQEPLNPPNTPQYGWYWAPYANHYIKP